MTDHSDTENPSASGRNIVQGSSEFHGLSREIIWLVIKNFLLNIVTLGFYRFWARTNVRRYLWEKMHVFGSPLEYTGTGKELFLGFLMIILVVFLPVAVLNVLLSMLGSPMISGLFSFVIALLFFYLIGVATYRARRYRLSRTRWRSIRAGQTGKGWTYGLWQLLLNTLMLLFALILPYKNLKLWQIKMQNTHLGDRFFVFDRDGAARQTLVTLYLSYAVVAIVVVIVYALPFVAVAMMLGLEVFNGTMSEAQIQAHVELNLQNNSGLLTMFGMVWPVSLIVFAIGMAWYKLKETRMLVALTSFEDLKISFDATLLSFFWLFLGNILIVLLTLGIGLPFTQVRFARFLANHTNIEGQLDLGVINQSADDDLTSGEGLAEAFDMGAV
ncbi:MAG: DUF898 domain-containing protein [Alphaproteobacteria bacterium]|jgi:uncharacterized membrane protein YjgN (DUF898 family)|nr:DUF898 domain-containing protein [Alphaproteobacteria bacterium]MBT4085089.1 DUF898 domain-containing protein [Alphaproteobacteria bacterium]MBT4546104.1 DUF898 domain-containing protein [Alphaproteobacteria bacterium]MBT7744348.1 DUF898 domain-containing protein [Alphaproteobacteria bacterium]